jgi:hypothetical protein
MTRGYESFLDASFLNQTPVDKVASTDGMPASVNHHLTKLLSRRLFARAESNVLD